MAGGATQDELMKPAALKLLLNTADRKALPCAIGEGDEPIMMVEKIGKPKKVLSQMLDEAKKMKKPMERGTARFGMATLDPNNTSTIQVKVNKPVKPSLQVGLRKMVKKIGFTEIIFLVDDALEEEPEDDVEGTAPAGTAPQGDAPGATAATTAPQTEPPRDIKALTAELTTLINKMKALGAVDPAYLHTANGFAAAAAGAIKAPDLALAETNLTSLREHLEKDPPAAPQSGTTAPNGAAPSAEACGKSRDAWKLQRGRLQGSITTLRTSIMDTYKDSNITAQLDAAFSKAVDPVLKALDDRLEVKLDEAAKAADTTARSRLMAEARAIMKEYTDYVESAQIVAELDTNPFVNTEIHERVTKTLEALSKVH
jgi:hypothetical protein